MLTSVNTFENDFTTKLVFKGIQEKVAAELNPTTSNQALSDLFKLVEYGITLPHTDILFEKTFKLYL